MIQQAQNILRSTVAASTNFQTLVGAANATEALDSVYHDELPKPTIGRVHTLDEITALRPCAIVFTPGDQEGWQVIRDAAGDDCWNPSGVLHCVIFRNVPEADKDDLAKVDTDFRDIVGDIVSDLISLSEVAGYLAADRISTMGPFRTKQENLKSEGDAQAYQLIIGWGHR